MDTLNVNVLLQRNAELERELAAKNRELKIEASLDRVRTRAIAMQCSDELKDLIALVSAELAWLDFVFDRCFIEIFDPETKGTTWWMSHPETPTEPICLFTKYHEHPPYLAKLEAWENRQRRWQYTLEGEMKKSWDQFLFAEAELSKLPPLVIENMRGLEKVYLSSSFNNFGCLSIATLKPLSEEHFDILLRFAKVFDLTYTRFNDLKQAEAQAREAQIELGLEKVRARAMAMQKSHELVELIDTVQKELTRLAISPNNCIFWIITDEPHGATWWVEPVHETRLPESYWVPFTDLPLFQSAFQAWKERASKWVYSLEGEDKKKTDQYIFTQTELMRFPHVVKKEFSESEKVYLAFSFYSYGGLHLSTMEPLAEDQMEILNRFSKVFDMTYTRFLDLQKAEAQAREAQIEASLERIRASAMAMHSSKDLFSVADVLYEQLSHLGKKELESSIIHFYPAQSSDFEVWYSYRPSINPTGQLIKNHIFIPKDACSWTKEVMLRYHSQSISYTIESRGNMLTEWYKVLERYARDTVYYNQEGNIILPEVLFYHFTKFAGGALLMISDEEPDNEAFNLQLRAAKVFEMAYKRFKDLEKAEAQAREAKIEAALEKVRSRTIGMQRSDELQDAALLMFQQVQALGVQAFAGGFNIWDDNRKAATAWMAQEFVLQPPFKTSSAEDVFFYIHKAAERGEALFVREQRGEELKTHYRYLASIPTFKGIMENMAQASHSVPTFQIIHCAFFAQGYLVFFTYEPVPEAYDIFKRFAKAFEQTYTRFLDLQRAEAQAREAQIEAAMERLRSKAMSMQTSAELNGLVQTMYLELKKLDESLNRCFIMIFNAETKGVTWWMAGADVDPTNYSYLVPYSEHSPQQAYLKGWEERQEKWQYIMEGEEKKAWDEYLFSATELAKLPGMVIQYMRSFEKIYLCASFSNFGCLASGSVQPLSETSFDILIRFTKVFDQTYTRFLDLQKAEAQAIRAEQDLTEIKAARKKAEDTLTELKATQTQLIQSEKMASLGQLTAGIAHEIQNPLNFVNNFSEINTELLEELEQEADKGNIDEVKVIVNEIKENEEKINHHGKRADAIVKGMLQHSRAGTGKKEPTDINAVADEYLRLSYHGLRAKDKEFNADFKTEFDEKVGKIEVVPQDIGRVLLNLFNNAFYAVTEKKKITSENYQPTVSVSTKREGDTVIIAVRDNGIGIPQKAVDKVFQPFFTTKPTGQGTGLGLSLSYDIVKAHGGEIKVESKEGEESVLIIRLPV